MRQDRPETANEWIGFPVIPVKLLDNADNQPMFENVGHASTTSVADLALRMKRDRIERRHVIPSYLLGDPAWDIVLDLFLATTERRRAAIVNVASEANIAPTTLLRWITRLTEKGVIEREADPHDARRAQLRLAPSVHRRMNTYLDGIAGRWQD